MADLLPAFPELRALAEAQARALWDAFVSAGRTDDALGILGPSARVRDAWVDAHLALLRDLSRPESRDAAARLLAAKVGLECGATAPAWRPTTGTLGGWVLVAGLRPRDCYEFAAVAPSCNPRPPGYVKLTVVPALAGVTDPAEALRLAVVAVWGGGA